MENMDFLPVSRDEMIERGWWWYDFLLVTGDAYVDHPSFGTSVIGRVLEAEGYRVAVLAQPDWHSAADFAAFGRPKLAVLIGAGNLDSMVAHYTAAKKRRSEDFYLPGKKAGLRPDRATIVYSNRAREAFPDVPIIMAGSRRACAALPTTTIGRTRCAGRYCSIRVRICSSTAWASMPSGR